MIHLTPLKFDYGGIYKKTPEKIRGVFSYKLIFFHPDSTVGSGIKPDQSIY